MYSLVPTLLCCQIALLVRIRLSQRVQLSHAMLSLGQLWGVPARVISKR